MTMFLGDGPVLVVAPHPDDEVLGVGGTIARLSAEQRDVFVVIVTRADPPIFPEWYVAQGRREAIEAQEVLGVRKSLFLEGFPAARLDTVPQADLHAALKDLVEDVEPDVLFVPFPGDLHVDHRRIAEAALVASRPNRARSVRTVMAYETLSETNWNAGLAPGFSPNVFVDISESIDTKIASVERYASQLKPFPHTRSVEALRALAAFRGATVGCVAAEAFLLIRAIFER